MKAKTLKKKIRRLETRLREGPQKLARLKRKLAALVAANESEAKRKLVARAAAARLTPRTATPPLKKKGRVAAKAPAERPVAKKRKASRKKKRKLNLSPERRAELSAAMKARWAAKKAAAAPNRDFTLGSATQES